MLRVPFFYAVPLLIINLGIVGYLEPYTHYRYEGLRFDLKSGALGAAIKVGEFNQLGHKLTLRIDRSENKGNKLYGIFLQMDQGEGKSVAATADQGRFLSTDDADVIIFRLTKGRLVQDSPKFPTPRTLAFDSYDLPISLPMWLNIASRCAIVNRLVEYILEPEGQSPAKQGQKSGREHLVRETFEPIIRLADRAVGSGAAAEKKECGGEGQFIGERCARLSGDVNRGHDQQRHPQQSGCGVDDIVAPHAVSAA